MHGLDLARNPEGSPIAFCEERKGAYAMARTKTRKLILNRAKREPLLFDLEKDPLELDNRYEDEAYQADVQELTRAIMDWRSFDDLPETYLDENAPVIDQPNVPSRDDDHREQLQAYFREKMKGDWAVP
jgi:hypothetical protein